jgi:hypothetical protein
VIYQNGMESPAPLPWSSFPGGDDWAIGGASSPGPLPATSIHQADLVFWFRGIDLAARGPIG